MSQVTTKKFDWFGVTGVEVKNGCLFFKVETFNDAYNGECEDRELVQVFIEPELRENLIRELLALDYIGITNEPVYIRDKVVVNMLARDKLAYTN